MQEERQRPLTCEPEGRARHAQSEYRKPRQPVNLPAKECPGHGLNRVRARTMTSALCQVMPPGADDSPEVFRLHLKRTEQDRDSGIELPDSSAGRPLLAHLLRL